MANMDYRDPEWVAQQLGIEKNTVYKFLQDGTIPALQLGRKWLISESRLSEWLEEQTRRQTDARREAAASAESTARRMTNYSLHAREAIRLAHAEARRYCHDSLGQGHLLLALAETSDCVAARAMAGLGITPEKLRQEIESRQPPGDSEPKRRLARSPDAKRAMRIARQMVADAGGDVVRTEHLLAGVLKAGDGIGCELLRGMGFSGEADPEEILRLAEAGNRTPQQ